MDEDGISQRVLGDEASRKGKLGQTIASAATYATQRDSKFREYM